MKQKGRIGSLIVLLVLTVTLAVTWFNRFAIYDWFRLRDYQPNSQVVALADADTMTSYARHMFYVNLPTIEDKSTFNQNCPNDGGEQTIVLGCYKGSETGIALYSVTDPKLNGVEQVTAAHETLHAAYDRLSSKDKTYVDGLLEDFYQNKLTDKRIKATIASYKKTEPNDVVNEMHSVFGTEVAKLPPPLETYYKKYFNNRQKIVDYAKQYQQTFVTNQALANNYLNQITSIEQQLTNLRVQIDSQESSLQAQNQQIESERGSTDPTTFNATVDQYNAQVRYYKTNINQYNSLIDEHNILVAKCQALNTETNQLIKELDSRSASVSTQ